MGRNYDMKNKDLIDRFIRYAKIDTQSSEESQTSPSTVKQHDLAKLLSSELRAMELPMFIMMKNTATSMRQFRAARIKPLGFIGHYGHVSGCERRRC